MDWSVSRSKWRSRTPRLKPFSLLLTLSLLFLILFLSSSPSLLSSKSRPSAGSSLCSVFGGGGGGGELSGERLLFYAPHSGFSNQVGELKNALLIGAILNRTVIVPPALDHHAVALGSCPKFRVSSPSMLRSSVWDHIMELVHDRRYVSMADIVDISSISPTMVRTIDFRVFASTFCGLDMQKACFSGLCCSLSRIKPSLNNPNQCKSLLSGLDTSTTDCIYTVETDCRNTVWTYNQNNNEVLDSFQPDKNLQKKKKFSFVRKRKDIYKAFGPGSKAEQANILAFGTVFSAPYKGSELYIDIKESPNDIRIQNLLNKIEFLLFVPEIKAAGEEFSLKNINGDFLCAQLRLLDGQFKNHWKGTFSALKQKLDSLKLEINLNKDSNRISIFIMTDLPRVNWTGTYLGEIAANEMYQLYTLQERDELVLQAAKRIMDSEHGIKSGLYPKILDRHGVGIKCEPSLLPDVLLYVEESVCSCAKLGFVGTTGSTIAESIETMRKNNFCSL